MERCSDKVSLEEVRVEQGPYGSDRAGHENMWGKSWVKGQKVQKP